MPQAGAIRAGRAFVELFADDSKLVRGLRRAEKRLRAFGDSIRSFGLKMAGAVSAITAPLGALVIRAAADAQESLSRFEQVFKDQADAAGDFADALAKSVGRSRSAIRDALATFQSFFVGLGFDAGTARELSQTLQKLALDFASFNNISDDEAIQRFIAALSGSSEVLDRFGINIKQAALQQELLRMGIRKSWADVTEQEKALARLSIITRAMGDQGAVGDAVRTAGSFTNQMKRLRGQMHDAAVAIGQALLPVVTPLVKKAAEAAKWFGQWIKRNQQLVATIFKVAAAVFAGGIALAALGTAIGALGGVFNVLITIVTGVGTALKLLGAALVTLVSPVGVVITAVVALGTTILYATGAGAKALGWLGEKFNVLKEHALAAYQGIAAALAAGDIALAARILWLSLKLAWQQGVAALNRVWLEAKRFFIGTAQKMWFGALAATQEVAHALEVVWIETTALLSKTWTNFTSDLRAAWHRVQNWLTRRWLDLFRLFGALTDEQAALAKQMADEDFARTASEIEQKRSSALTAREAQRRREREDAAALNEATLAEIGGQFEAAQQQLDADTSARIAETQRQLAEARKQLDEALARAKRRREGGEAEGAPSERGPRDLLAGLKDRIAGLGDELARRISVSGTFNATAALGLGAGGGTAERTARATEETAKHTKRLVDAAVTGGLTFT